MRTRRPFFAALAALAAILFAQLAIAAASWESAPSPCHEQMPSSSNLCAQHCSNNDLTLDVPRIKLPAVAPASAPVAVSVPVRYPPLVPVRIAVLPAGPPPRILFQSFLI